MSIPRVTHQFANVQGVRVFYRSAGPEDAPALLLLHGFPSSSHQFRRLIDALGTRYRVIAPDYPGFGHTQAPPGFTYSFDRLADVLDGFAADLELDRFVMYVFDFGGPVGFRLAARSASSHDLDVPLPSMGPPQHCDVPVNSRPSPICLREPRAEQRR
jgi:pimeloyl-ACP methyl ester carboxylesterase